MGDTTVIRVPAASSGSSGIANNSSGVKWSCGYCGREFDTKIGLGVHKSHQHREPGGSHNDS